MLNSLMIPVLQGSLTAGVVILALVLLSGPLNRRYTAKWKYWVWLALAVRMLIPFGLSLPDAPVQIRVPIAWADASPVWADAEPVQAVTDNRADMQATAGITAYAAVQEPVADTLAPPSRVRSFSPFERMGMIWALGFSGFLVWQIAVYRAHRRRALRWGRPASDERILNELASLRAEMRIRREIEVLAVDWNESPQMIGYLRPLLLLGRADYADADLAHILRHELVHFRRRDLWYKLLLTLANAAHWFNPLAWLMVREACADLELSCDDIVMRDASRIERESYSETILASIRGHQRVTTALTTNFRGGMNAMKKRFENILTSKRRRFGFAPLIAALALMLALSTLVGVPGLAQRETSGPQYAANATAIEGGGIVDPNETAKAYAKYAQYGLIYDTVSDRLYYNGRLVRYFEDMYPIDEHGYSGLLQQHADGAVDVRAVRDLTLDRYNAEGSINPAGRLIGVEPYTQEEFDRRTEELSQPLPAHVDAASVADTSPQPAEEGAAAVWISDASSDGGYWTYSADSDNWVYHADSVTDAPEIEWWTVDEFAAWLEWKREELPKIIGSRGKFGDGDWFTWTQKEVDEALAMYEKTLQDIKNGALVSKDFTMAVDLGDVATQRDVTTVHEQANAVEATSGTVLVDVVEDTSVVHIAGDAPTLSEYSRKAWKMDYPQLVQMVEAWDGRVFLCAGPVVEIVRGASGNEPQLLAMNVAGEGEAPQYVILENKSSVSAPKVGQKYSVYADVNGTYLYENMRCPKLTARYILESGN